MSECQRCAKCCISATFNYAVVDKIDIKGHVRAKDMGKWLAFHGCDAGATEHGDKYKYFVSIPIVCRHLGRDDKKKEWYCDIHETDDMPDLCKRFNCGGL